MADSISTESDEARPSDLREIVKELLSLSATKNEERNKRLDESGERFNVFSVLNMTTNEVNCHSRFLHELLSPDGSHGMQATFLALFFEKVLRIPPEPWLTSATVQREVSFDDGRIDLLIEVSGRCCIVIEVKIYASDQYRQIARYYDFIERKYPAYLLKGVYYLTLDGHEPDESSIGEAGAEYTCLSFGTDVVPWLATCAEEVSEKPRLCGAIKQYIDVLNGLTGAAEMDEEMRYVTNAIAASSINYEAAVQIADALPKARTSLLRKIFSDFKAHLDIELPGCDLTSSAEQEDIESYYSRPGREKPLPRLRFKLKEDGDHVLAFVVELEWRLYMGIAFFKRNDSQVGFARINSERAWLDSLSGTDAWRRVITSAPEEDWWLDWRYLDDPSSKDENNTNLIDFRNGTNENKYLVLYDRGKYERRMKQWTDNIDAYLDEIEGKFGIAFRTR